VNGRSRRQREREEEVWDNSFKENCPSMASDSNTPTHDLIGVSGLGIKDQLVKIACSVVLPDE
jgi:hypothetical protein